MQVPGYSLIQRASAFFLVSVMGVLKMDRAACMFSMLHHLDTRRAKDLQRFQSTCDIIVSVRSQELTKHVSLSDILVASGNVSIQVPVPRFAFDRIVQTSSSDGGLVWFDSSWANHAVEGRCRPS